MMTCFMVTRFSKGQEGAGGVGGNAAVNRGGPLFVKSVLFDAFFH